MNKNTATVLRGYINLTDAEKEEFIDKVNSYNRDGRETKVRLGNEASRVMKIDLGPVGTGCACCGR